MSGPRRAPAAFTIRAKNGRLNALITDCLVCEGFDPARGMPDPHPPMPTFRAIWDTGATGSVVTQRVVQACGLKPIGFTRVSTAGGMRDSSKYVANIMLPNRVGFPMLTVTEGELTGGVDVLIGMDIITQGDFAITHRSGLTVFTFRYPSLAEFDFVKETEAESRRASGARPMTPGQSFFGGKKKRR